MKTDYIKLVVNVTVLIMLTMLCVAVHATGVSDEELLNPDTDYGYGTEILKNDLDSEIIIKVTVEELRIHTQTIDDRVFTVLSVDGAGTTFQPGEPQLPLISRMYRVSDTRETIVDVIPLSVRTYQLDAPVLPSQAKELADIISITAEKSYLYQDGVVLPENPLRVGDPEILRDIRVQQISYSPVRYYPGTGKLELIESAELRIRCGELSDKNVITGEKPRVPAVWNELYEAVVPNYDGSNFISRGQDHYLVVIPAENVGYLTEWKLWKETEGTIVDILTVTGSTTANQLRNQILTAFESGDRPAYILLAGNEFDVPFKTSSYNYNWNGDYWDGSYTDEAFYTRLAGDDYLPDVFLARLSGSTALPVMFNRSLFWETTPNVTENYYSTALMSCSGLYASQQATKEQTKERLERMHGYESVYEKYDWNFNTLDQVMEILNNGVSIVNYRGEGWTDGWNPGHYFEFYTGDVEEIYSPNRPMVFTSIGCGVGNFTGGYCFGEAWIRLGTEEEVQGAVAFCGPTWNTHTTFNNWLDRGMYRGLAYDDLSVVAQAYLAGKIYMRDHLPEYDEIVEMEFNLFLQLGTPDTRYRTILPQAPYYGPAFAPTNMDRYVAMRTCENRKAVGAKITLDPGGINQGYLSLGLSGEGVLGLPESVTSVSVSVSGYNMVPETGVLNFTGDSGRLLITEVKPDISTDGLQGDMVELYNADTVAVDLRNMILTDLDLYDLPIVRQSAILAPDEFAVIHFVGARGEETIVERSYGLEITSRAFPDFSEYIDQCVLRDYTGRVLDGLAWNSNTGEPVSRDNYRDLSRFTAPVSLLTVKTDGWWLAPDDCPADEYEYYTIDWSEFAGHGGEGSIQRIIYSDSDSLSCFGVAAATTWGAHTTGLPTPTPRPTLTPTPTSTPTVVPTSTPTVAPTSTPTVDPTSTPVVTLGVQIIMPAEHFETGDDCYVQCGISNPGAAFDANVVVALDVAGNYWFWPSWCWFPDCSGPAGIDALSHRVETGYFLLEIIPAFAWPADTGAASGLKFWGLMLNETFSQVIGEFDTVEWSYDSTQ